MATLQGHTGWVRDVLFHDGQLYSYLERSRDSVLGFPGWVRVGKNWDTCLKLNGFRLMGTRNVSYDGISNQCLYHTSHIHVNFIRTRNKLCRMTAYYICQYLLNKHFPLTSLGFSDKPLSRGAPNLSRCHLLQGIGCNFIKVWRPLDDSWRSCFHVGDLEAGMKIPNRAYNNQVWMFSK